MIVLAHWQRITAWYAMICAALANRPCRRASYSHVADLRALLDYLHIEEATLVGFSKGGGVALDFALVHPTYVQGLVLIDTILGGIAWSAAAPGAQ